MFPLADTNDGRITCYTLTKDFLIYGTDVREKENEDCFDFVFVERSVSFLLHRRMANGE